MKPNVSVLPILMKPNLPCCAPRFGNITGQAVDCPLSLPRFRCP